MAAAEAIRAEPIAELIGPTGLYGVYENGREHTVYHFYDIAAGFVKSARTLIPDSAWTLVDLMTGTRIAADEAEWQALLIEEYEAREAEEGWGVSPLLHKEGIALYVDGSLPQSDMDWSELPAMVRSNGSVRLGDVSSAALLIDLAQELRALALTVTPIGKQMVEVRAA